MTSVDARVTTRVSRTAGGRVRFPAVAARQLLFRLLEHVDWDRLTIEERTHDRSATHVFAGRRHDSDPLEATVIVHDTRAYAAIVGEGSVGLGRGYIEGWWSSPDPVAVVRVLIRNMATIDRWRNRVNRVTRPITDRIRLWLPRDSRHRNREDISAHYDIGNDFFELFLDETMTYSSAVFEHPGQSLADASRHKYDLLIDRLELTADHHLLEIGSGWGGLAIRAVERTGCRVTTTTISTEQHREATNRVAAAGFADRVTVLDADWRDLTGRFDRVISIEMIEAVDWRDYGAYFATIEQCLVPGGRAAIQAICLPDDRWERAKNTEDFIKHFVFPNGYLPSVAAITDAVDTATRMRVAEVEDYGLHYAETLLRWRQSLHGRIGAVRSLGLDQRFCRLWDFYLAYCEAGMRERHCTVTQILLTSDAGAR